MMMYRLSRGKEKIIINDVYKMNRKKIKGKK